MKPSLYYPVRPFHINQAFGNNIPCVKDYGKSTQSIISGADNDTCPIGYTKLYAIFGMKGHDGTDLEAGVQNVFAAMDGKVVEMQTNPRLGLGLGIISSQTLDLGQYGTHYLKMRYWHLKSFNVAMGQDIKAGGLLGISDNTGYSSGNHLHFEGDPMSLNEATGEYGYVYPDNGYGGAIDIAPYFNGIYADTLTLTTLYTILVNTLQALLNALKAGRINNQTT